MIEYILYIIGIFLSTLALYFTGILNVDFYDISSLLFIYKYVDLKMVLAFVLIYGLSLSFLYWIKIKNENPKLMFLASFVSSFPFLMLSYFVFDIGWFILLIVCTLGISYIINMNVLREEKIYKVIPYDKLSVKLFKNVLSLFFIIFALFLAFTSSSRDNSIYINNLTYHIGKINLTDITNLENKIISLQRNYAINIANATTFILMNEIFNDNSLSYNTKVQCLRAIDSNRENVLDKIDREISRNASNNIGQFEDISGVVEISIKAYPIIIGLYVYVLLGFTFFFISFASQVLVKIYKLVYHK